MVLRDVEAHSVGEIVADREFRFDAGSRIRRNEIQRQFHYMRRQLSPAMHIIDERIPLYQMFASPSVYGAMWKYAPECRTDQVYATMLSDLPGRLLDIPWARTGTEYIQGGQEADDLSVSHSRYGRWLRRDLRPDVIALATGDEIRRLGVFNYRTLDYLARSYGFGFTKTEDRVDERVAWLASLALFIRHFDIRGIHVEDKLQFSDKISAVMGIAKVMGYRLLRTVIRE